MMKRLLLAFSMLFFVASAHAQEAEAEAESEPVAEATEASDVAEEASVAEPQGDGITSSKTLSGMSILGNEEAPKSLVIIPWKSSQLGDDISLSDTLDNRARPVDKEVFLRELSYYEIRSGE